MTRVAVIGMGGTIAMAPSAAGGVVPALDAADLIAAVPGLAELGLEITACGLRSLPSPSLSFGDLAALSATVQAEIDAGAAGVVVTHGTDTIEETALFLDVTIDSEVPVVVTGAMRHPTSAGADGPANLFAAIRVAASDTARGLGALVVMSDEVHGARFVRKGHTSSTAAFVSPGFGPLGLVVEGEPRLRGTPRVPLHLPAAAAVSDLRVALVTVALGDDGELLRLGGPAFDGIVLAGLGAGHVPAGMVPIVSELAARVPVVLASRTGSGPVLRHTYGYPGSERDLLDRGLVHAGFLDPAKARVLLLLLLANGADRARIVSAFEHYR
ncbi:asparaginase [Actinokineospora cianjurensis]|uniref:L-asparaginase n=1 Tax=Actinokineospora cianjurensis TaxID=585224 RepID=A0A421AU01_9PSEU|nr:asparaginase [Actinokineospora cianjurensis]RLK53565.1 L-asparaginase [Actinokineospora cianjurensis]